MYYIINGSNLETDFDFIAGLQAGSNIALSGFLDMPARLGKCYHSWNSEAGIEPYTSANEIRFGGRNLSLTGHILGTNREDCLIKANELKKLFDGFTDLAALITDWGSFQVYIKGAIVGEYVGEQGLKITMQFREPFPDISGTLPNATANNEFGFDGITFESFGSFLSEFEGDRRNRPAPKAFDLTSWQTESYNVTKTEAANLRLKFFIEQPTYSAFKGKIKSFYALFKQSGERNLIVENDFHRRVFACNGFQVTEINRTANSFYGFLEIELMQSSQPQVVTFLGDSVGNYITDNLNNKILLKWD